MRLAGAWRRGAGSKRKGVGGKGGGYSLDRKEKSPTDRDCPWGLPAFFLSEETI